MDLHLIRSIQEESVRHCVKASIDQFQHVNIAPINMYSNIRVAIEATFPDISFSYLL